MCDIRLVMAAVSIAGAEPSNGLRGGLTVREAGERFRRELLSRGGSVEAMTMFRHVVGEGRRIEPLLERRGLA